MNSTAFRRTRNVLGGVVATAAGIALLTGCTATVTPADAPQADETAVPSQEADTMPQQTHTVAPDAPTPAGEATNETQPGAADGDTVRIDCDDNAYDDRLVIDQPGVYEIVDDCDLVIVSADGATIMIDEADDIDIQANEVTITAHEIDDLYISGNANTVSTNDLDDIEVSGSDNMVSWADDDDVDIRDTGANNSFVGP